MPERALAVLWMDDPRLARLYEPVMEAFGVREFRIAATAREILMLAGANRYDLILLADHAEAPAAPVSERLRNTPGPSQKARIVLVTHDRSVGEDGWERIHSPVTARTLGAIIESATR